MHHSTLQNPLESQGWLSFTLAVFGQSRQVIGKKIGQILTQSIDIHLTGFKYRQRLSVLQQGQ